MYEFEAVFMGKIPVGAFRGQPLYAKALISAGEPTIYVSVSSAKSTTMPTEAISAQCSKNSS